MNMAKVKKVRVEAEDEDEAPVKASKKAKGGEERTDPSVSRNKLAWAKQSAWVSLDSIAPGKNSRKELGDLTALTKDIRANGIRQSLLVVPGKKAGTYKLVAGFRRFQIAKTLGFKDVPVLIDPNILSEVDEIAANVAENSSDSRFALPPMDEATAYKRMMDADGKLQPKDVATRCGCSDQHVRSRIALLTAPKNVQAAVNNRKMSIGAAEALTNIPDAKVRDKILADTDLDVLTEKLVKARANQIAGETGATLKKREGKKEKGAKKAESFKLTRSKKEMNALLGDTLYAAVCAMDKNDKVEAAFSKGIAAAVMYYTCEIDLPIESDNQTLAKAIQDMAERSLVDDEPENEIGRGKKTKAEKPAKAKKHAPVEDDVDDFDDDEDVPVKKPGKKGKHAA
jgi:ParB/RepB/Spo0J family partition protein